MEHSFNREETYGYKTFEKREDWEAAVRTLFAEQIEAAVPLGLCAAVYTQLSDVEDETNGLVTYDRRVVKADRPLTASGPIPAPVAEAAKKEEQA